MKRILSVILCIVCTACMLVGCATQNVNTEPGITVTVYPVYDWVKNIAGDSIDVNLIVNDGTDMHSYQPSAEDIIKIRQSKLVIYVGGQSEEWISETVDGDTICLIDNIQALEAEHDGHIETDEHVWLSLKNAKLFCTLIAHRLSKLYPENESQYLQNATEYISKLDALDKKYEQTMTSSPKNTLVICDRFPFAYLVNDYEIPYVAAFPGCSAESEADFETITTLAKEVSDSVIILDGSDTKLADTVISVSGCKNCEIFTLNSMQSKTDKDYLTVMEENLNVLEKVLN